jgi:hypothetical protein
MQLAFVAALHPWLWQFTLHYQLILGGGGTGAGLALRK